MRTHSALAFLKLQERAEAQAKADADEAAKAKAAAEAALSKARADAEEAARAKAAAAAAKFEARADAEEAARAKAEAAEAKAADSDDLLLAVLEADLMRINGDEGSLISVRVLVNDNPEEIVDVDCTADVLQAVQSELGIAGGASALVCRNTAY